ncbi:hypothetical protein [Halobellus ordinarius]|uniref:hypothetical protein n=1 Tax=Halobellus ordinarius TaxID=3075120 RepID=UPI002880A347|nr:hypothetical protein [Halobellus sp. ZY16]
MDEFVLPKEPRLDSAPDPDFGKILEVECDRVDERRVSEQSKACQQCGGPVALSEPHIWARGKRDSPAGAVHFSAVFCSDECWRAWASADE